MNKHFGDYIRQARNAAGIGQRELARRLQISAPYLNDLEHSKRKAPSNGVLQLLRQELELDDEKFNDLAGLSKHSLPPDVFKYLYNNSSALSLVRVINNIGLPNKKILELKKMITSENYKAIIIAAGLGSRLGNLTKEIPKCMLELNGKSILKRQLEAYKVNGIKDVSVIRGYLKNKINLKGLKYYENNEYQSNNILNSLFYAEKELNGNVIVSYSDIIFSPKIVERLLESSADISIVVDVDWRGRYVDRKDHPIDEAENVIFDANHSVVDIGKIMTGPSDVHGEFIGMIKFTPRGADIFKRHFNRAKQLFWDKPYQKSKKFQNAYVTDILKDMADLGVPIHSVIIEQGWQEIDTIEDYKNALSRIKEFEYV